MVTRCVGQTKVCLQKKHSPVPQHIVTWQKTIADCLCIGKKTGQSKPPCTSQDGGSAQHPPWATSTTVPAPPQQHCCSEGSHEKTPPCFGRKKRNRLSCGRKDSYYLLFKSGGISGHRSMRKGNFQAERIWTLEIFVEKWCLLVSYAIGVQTHPVTPGRHQKGPFCVAKQRKAGCPGGA